MNKTCKHSASKTCMYSSWYKEHSNHEDTKTHPLTHRETEKERKSERKKVHSLPIKGVLFHVLPGILVWTDEQVSKLFSTSTISHFHCSIFNNFIKHNQSAFLYHGCQETVTISNIRRYYDFKVEGKSPKNATTTRYCQQFIQ